MKNFYKSASVFSAFKGAVKFVWKEEFNNDNEKEQFNNVSSEVNEEDVVKKESNLVNNFVQEKIKAYEKTSSEIARSHNSVIENLLGTGLVSNEDIGRIDAEVENELRDDIKYHEESKVGDFKHVKELQKKLDSFSTSNLILKESNHQKESCFLVKNTNIWKKRTDYELIGMINDYQDDLLITRKIKATNGFKDLVSWKGSLNKRKLTELECCDFFNLYFKQQQKKMWKIETLIEKRKKEKEEAKK